MNPGEVGIGFSDDGRDFTRRDWTDLVGSDPAGTFFHTPAYLKLYWEEFGEDLSLHLALVEDGNLQVAAAAFEQQGAELRFLGGTEVTDYLGPVAIEPGVEMAAAILQAMVERGGWTHADLRNLPEDSPWLPALTHAAEHLHLWAQAEEQDVCPYVPLSSSFEDYLTTLPAKLRHEIRRKARRLETEGGAFRLVWSDAATIDADLDRFFELHRSSEGPKGKFMQPGMEIFFRRLAQTFLPTDVFRLGFIQIGEAKVAGAIGFVDRPRGRFLLYNSAFDHDWKALSPGMVLVAEFIRASIEEGLIGFDMLKGGLDYKYRFGAHPRRLMRLQLTREA
jgi:CelD/BcsL family acetyltransferase involved in cellulose biosynthesis